MTAQTPSVRGRVGPPAIPRTDPPGWLERLAEQANGGGIKGATISVGAGMSILLGLVAGWVLKFNAFRWPIALLLLFALITISIVRPPLAVLLTISYLILLAFFRRLLIPLERFTPYDPLLLVGPVMAVVLFVRYTIMSGRRVVADRTSAIITILLLLGLLEAVNPLGGGIAVGFLGLLYLTVPLLWFYVGRDLVRPPWTRRIMWALVWLAVANAVYGLIQTSVGMPSWDLAWYRYAQAIGFKYTALSVAGAVRAWGTFSSSSEYAFVLGAAGSVALAAAIRMRRPLLALPVPLLAYALFISSARTSLVLFIMATILAGAAGRKTSRRALISIVASLVLLVGIDVVVGRTFTATGATDTQSRLVEHQIGGLTKPLDPTQSTLGGHISLMIGGLRIAVEHPTGLGTGATSIASDRGAGTSNSTTEVDLTNVFISFGIFGGLLFAVLLARVMWTVGREAFGRHEVDAILILAVLVASFGQWLNGGLYALSPLVWLLVGSVVGQVVEREEAEREASTGAAAEPV